jgi:hypothetical protein
MMRTFIDVTPRRSEPVTSARLGCNLSDFHGASPIVTSERATDVPWDFVAIGWFQVFVGLPLRETHEECGLFRAASYRRLKTS